MLYTYGFVDDVMSAHNKPYSSMQLSLQLLQRRPQLTQMLLDNWLRPLPDANWRNDQTSPNEEVPGRRLVSTTLV